MDWKSYRIEGWKEAAIYVLLSLTFVLLILLTLYTGFNSIYTQLFILPVTLASLWNDKKGILLALLYGLTGITVSWHTSGSVTLPDLYQGAMYVMVAAAVGLFSEKRNRLAVASLKTSVDHYASQLESFPGLIWRSDSEGRGVAFNENWLAFTGRSHDQEIGDGWQQSIHGADIGRRQQTFLGARETGRGFECTYRLRRADGEYRWALEVCRPYPGPDGHFSGYISFVYDITDRRIAAEELEAKNRELQMMCSILSITSQYKDIQEMFATVLRQTNSLVSASASAIFIDETERPGIAVLAAYDNEAAPQARFRQEAPSHALHEGGELVTVDVNPGDWLEPGSGDGKLILVPLESMARKVGIMALFYPDGQASSAGGKWDRSHAPLLVSIGSHLGTAIDCAAQYRRLVNENARLAEIIEEAPDAILTTDAAGCIGTFNRQAGILLKYSRGEIKGKHISSILPPGASIVIKPGFSYVREFRAGDDTIVKLNIAAALLPSPRLDESMIITLKDLTTVSGLKIVPVCCNKYSPDNDQEYHFKRGVVYLIKRQEIDYHMDIFADQVRQGVRSLCISRQSPKMIREQYGLENTPVIWLCNSNAVEDVNAVMAREINNLTRHISEFTDSGSNGIIMLDGMEYLMARNGFDAMLKFAQFLNDRIMVSDCSAMFCIDTHTLDKRQLHLLLTEMTEFRENS
ncbi:DUF835 domain-containing protein [Methanocella arvoryzae]|uniref:histidine kinase n=1 Tax=Methanocella arvoryzae (strain DSM 22066 / NBRC 105507 / MRE50) TaxID=351160 RepID=Q0W8F5_METAR|nr:DUF835 domain-containing protein [Methanocella arvoryzae]CAJ35338.1 predicted signal transduction protein [Methanocella arvoryzae MRE50]